MDIQLKRAYQPADPNDGYRILVDRLWPRGVSRISAHIDLWFKDIAPSPALRKWYGHEPSRWDEFRAQYFRELEGIPEAVERIVERSRSGRVTLVYAAKDTEHSHALALRDFIEKSTEDI